MGPCQAQIEHAVAGHEVAATEAFTNALSPTFAEPFSAKIIQSYRPKGAVLPDAAVAKVLRHITGVEDPYFPESAFARYFAQHGLG